MCVCVYIYRNTAQEIFLVLPCLIVLTVASQNPIIKKKSHFFINSNYMITVVTVGYKNHYKFQLYWYSSLMIVVDINLNGILHGFDYSHPQVHHSTNTLSMCPTVK